MIHSKKAIIYCSPRTGSSLLGSFFAPHPDVYYIYEDYTLKPAGQPYSASDLRRVYDKFKKIHPSKLMMVKMFYFQTHNSEKNYENQDLLSEFRNWKVLHLTRKNLLDVVASHVLVSSNKHLSPQYGGAWFGVNYDRKVYLDPEKCLAAMELLKTETLMANKYLKKYGINYKTIVYENMIEEKESTYDELQKFLGLPILPLESNSLFIKQRKGTLKENLENYDEIEDILSGTEFECYLD